MSETEDVILPDDDVVITLKRARTIFTLGLLSTIFSAIGISVVGIVLGIIATTKYSKLRKETGYESGRLTAGLVLGIIGLSLGGASLLFSIIFGFLASLFEIFSSLIF